MTAGRLGRAGERVPDHPRTARQDHPHPAVPRQLAEVERQLDTGRVSVCRGGKALLRKRNHLADAGLTETRWRERWAASRLFLTADGEKDKTWGNETIRWNPDQNWLEIRLPTPLARLANRPNGRYRLSCPVEFTYRGGDVAAQAATGAVRYDISLDPARGRWYLDASWKTPATGPITLAQARQGTVVAVDVNAGHLAVAVLGPDGNQAGIPYTIDLPLAGLPSSTRDGRLRAAITSILTTAREHRASAVVIENLDFGDARRQGRERTGSRPSRGRRGRAFRHQVAGIPTARFRDRLTHMAANAGMAVIAVDPAYTSRWGAQHWLAPLQQHHPKLTGHHAAAFVIGRRGLGLRARRRASGNLPAPEDAAAPQRAKSTQARPRPTRRPGPKPGDPPPGRTHGSHQAPRPEGPDGPRQATRRPKTVRDRPPGRTRSCQVTRNGSSSSGALSASTGRSSQMRPHLPSVTLTSTAAVIPMPASAAITGGAKRPDDGRAWALADLATGAWDAGRVAGRSASRSLSSPQVRAASARPIRSSNSPAVSLPAWKCSLRSNTTASRSNRKPSFQQDDNSPS